MDPVAVTTVSEPEPIGLGLFLTEELWRENKMRGWATLGSLLFILVWQIGRWLVYRAQPARSRTTSLQSLVPPPLPPSSHSVSPSAVSDIVSDEDLKNLIDNLDEKDSDTVKWENVIDRSSSSLDYKAKCCKPKDGPLKYLSLTKFEACSPKVLRDFYMDNDFRKQWDNTLVEHEQLYIDETTGVEIGRTIKKFPFLTPREYILAWRVWEGNNNVFYCLIKECEHPSAPRSRKYVRVGTFRSGWRIRQVPGTNACEIKMVHQEDAGFNVEMTKLAFAKGIWSFVCKMEKALCKYSSTNQDQSYSEGETAVTYIQRVPDELEVSDAGTSHPPPPLESTSVFKAIESENGRNAKEVKIMPSKKLIANGLLLLGGLLYLSKSHHSLGAKVAIACIWKKLSMRASPATESGVKK